MQRSKGFFVDASNDFTTEYRCPYCLNDLAIPSQTCIECLGCEKKYGVLNEIIDFSRSSGYFYSCIKYNELIKHMRDQEQTSEDPFYKIVTETSTRPEKILRRKLSMENLPWHLLIGIHGNHRVLDIGCGMGFAAIRLAQYYDQVYACDLTWENVQLVKKRAEYHSIRNIKYICGFDSPYFPFRDNFFDVVFLNGVLEHVFDNPIHKRKGDSSKFTRMGCLLRSLVGKNNPKTAQSDFLKEINRVLAHDGTLFIGIENRLSRQYLAGAPEDHILMKYITLLPRIPANLYAMAYKRKPYLTYTYSLWGYTKLLKGAGFQSQRFYGMQPNYSDVETISDTAHFSSPETGISASGIKPVVKGWMEHSKKVQQYLPHCFGIVARKKDPSTNIIEEITSDLNRSVGNGQWKISDHNYFVTQKGTLVAKLYNSEPDRDFVIKIGLNPSASAQLTRNYCSISKIHTAKALADAVIAVVPEPMVKGQYSQYQYFIEEYKAGTPSVQLRKKPDEMKHVLKNAAGFIEALHESTRNEAGFSVAVQESIVDWKLDRLAELFAGEERKYLEEIRNYLKENILSDSLFSVFHKGDCSAHNVLVSKENVVSAIIDWDQSDQRGFPFVDLLNLIESFKRCLLNVGMGQILRDYFFTGGFDRLEREIIRHYCDRLGLSEKAVMPMTILYWMDHINAQDFDHMKYDDRWIAKNVMAVLRHLKENL